MNDGSNFNGPNDPNGSNRPNFKDVNANFKKNSDEIKKQMKHAIGSFITFLIVIVVLASVNSFIYTVAEDEVAIVREFGNISKVIVDVGDEFADEQNKIDAQFSDVEVIKRKGLFFKIPFITQVEKHSSKLLTYISNKAQINTRDKIKYDISMFAQWEISHPGLFSTTLGSETKANSIIDEVAYAVVIEKINSLDSKTFLTDKTVLNESLDDAMASLNERLRDKGIVITDISVYRTILPDSNIASTHKKMVAERAAIAQKKRSEGQELYQNTVAETDREVATIESKAIEEAERIKGEADATALEIYANAFNKDLEFYKYWRTLKSYSETIDADTVIYLDKSNDYLNYFSGE